MALKLHKDKCFTGRQWVSIFKLHIGLGPSRLVERIQYDNKIIYAYRK